MTPTESVSKNENSTYVRIGKRLYEELRKPTHEMVDTFCITNLDKSEKNTLPVTIAALQQKFRCTFPTLKIEPEIRSLIRYRALYLNVTLGSST